MNENENEENTVLELSDDELSEMIEKVKDDMNRCPHCGSDGKEWTSEDCDIVWCTGCGRLYVMPMNFGLTYDPLVPEIFDKFEEIISLIVKCEKERIERSSSSSSLETAELDRHPRKDLYFDIINKVSEFLDVDDLSDYDL